MSQKIYIAGKITGLSVDNYTEKFKAAANEIKSRGLVPVNPVQLVSDPNAKWNEAMKICIAELMKCDAVMLLPCTKDSPGAMIEKELAEKLQIPTFESFWCLQQHFRNR